MSEDRRRILELLSASRINVDEAERLLEACGGDDEGNARTAAGAAPTPRYIKMVGADEAAQETFRVTVPLSLIRAGIKLQALIPEEAREHTINGLQAKGIGINPFEIPSDQIDEFIQALGELEIDVSDDGSRFRLYLE